MAWFQLSELISAQRKGYHAAVLGIGNNGRDSATKQHGRISYCIQLNQSYCCMKQELAPRYDVVISRKILMLIFYAQPGQLRFFAEISATPHAFLARIRIFVPTRHPSTTAREEITQWREPEKSISNESLLQASGEIPNLSWIADISASPNAFLALIRDFRSPRHPWTTARAEITPSPRRESEWARCCAVTAPNILPMLPLANPLLARFQEYDSDFLAQYDERETGSLRCKAY